ncbi:unnamed protein product, partial [Prorocentrum cordatum]
GEEARQRGLLPGELRGLESVKWLSKAIWLAEEWRGLKATRDLRSILRSNRAFALLRLERWAEAEADCSKALGFNAKNVKAHYRRAMARLELGMAEGAMQDVDRVLEEMPSRQSNAEAVVEAVDLRRKIREKLGLAPAEEIAARHRRGAAAGVERPRRGGHSHWLRRMADAGGVGVAQGLASAPFPPRPPRWVRDMALAGPGPRWPGLVWRSFSISELSARLLPPPAQAGRAARCCSALALLAGRTRGGW